MTWPHKSSQVWSDFYRSSWICIPCHTHQAQGRTLLQGHRHTCSFASECCTWSNQLWKKLKDTVEACWPGTGMHGPTLSHDTHTLAQTYAHRVVHISLHTHIDKTALPCAHLQMQISANIRSMVQRGSNSPTGPGQHWVEFTDFFMSIKRHSMGALYLRHVKVSVRIRRL